MHRHPQVTDIGLPTVAQLGCDLLQTTPSQRRWALLRPLLGLAAYVVAAALGWWVITPLIVFLIFVAVVTVTHDVVHGSLGLSKRHTEWALLLMGGVLMESGHAYRVTHRQHHITFPDDDDPEGYPAKIGLLGAVVYGPVFITGLWLWAFQRRPDQRGWLAAEALVSGGLLAAMLRLLVGAGAIVGVVLLAGQKPAVVL